MPLCSRRPRDSLQRIWGVLRELINGIFLVASLILRLVKSHQNDADFGDWSGNTATCDPESQLDERHGSGASGHQPSLVRQSWSATEDLGGEEAVP